MNNILRYARDVRESFAQKPFCEVDSLILCQLSNLQLGAICDGARETTIRRLAEEYDSDALYADTWVAGKTRRLLRLAAENPRFCDITLRFFHEEYDAEREMQFAAVTFVFENTAYIAFRGTDMTFIGWKEDFNMAHTFPVPAQTAGYAYLRSVAARLPGSILLGGHSKGGNIALYAAREADDDLLARIGAIYSHDNPGFLDSFYDMRFERFEARVLRTIPRSSLVGMILCHKGAYTVVQNYAPGFFQHNPFTWQIKDGEFCTRRALSRYARLRNRILNRWIHGLSLKHRKIFVDTVFGVMIAAGAKTFSEFFKGFHHRIAACIRFIFRLDRDARRTVLHLIRLLICESFRALRA